MPISQDLLHIAPELRFWAQRTICVRRLWIFGSRVRGEHQPESDLDIAIEIDPTEADVTAVLAYLSNFEHWRSELQQSVPYEVDLEIYDPAHVIVKQGVDSHGFLVYERGP